MGCDSGIVSLHNEPLEIVKAGQFNSRKVLVLVRVKMTERHWRQQTHRGPPTNLKTNTNHSN